MNENKKKILVVLFDYYPYHSANTICMESFINKLIVGNYNIHILTQNIFPNSKRIDSNENIYVYSIDNSHDIFINRMRQIFNIKMPNKIIAMINKIIIYLIEISLIVVQKIYCFIHGLTLFEEVMVKEIVKLHKINKYACMITVSAPFSCQLVGAKASEILDDSCKLISFALDPYTYNVALNRKKICRRLEMEKYTFQRSQLIITTNEIYFENKNNEFMKYIYKTIPICYPNLKPIVYEPKNADRFEKNKDYVECVYSGVFYLELRNPSFMLEFIQRANNKRIRLHLYCKYDNEKLATMIDVYKQILGDCLIVHGFQDKDTVYDAILNCDILINLGNTVKNQIPSKIFEYISTGKPIINFYVNNEDPSLSYFNRYPLILNIKQSKSDYEEKLSEFLSFCCKNKGKNLSFKEATSKMNEMVSENVMDKFEGIIQRI